MDAPTPLIDGPALALERRRLALTQEQVARALSVGRKSVSIIEGKAVIRPDVAERYREALRTASANQ